MRANGEKDFLPNLSVIKEDNDLIMKELDKMSSINNVNISNKNEYIKLII